MNRIRRIGILLFCTALLAACGGSNPASAPTATPAGGNDLAAAASSTYSPLTLRVADDEREVLADSDEIFDLWVANESAQDVPVVFVLEHAGGEPWRTSLCVGDQCILGDGSGETVSDVVFLPPLFEQSFQAHVFVDAAARPGQQTGLILRVEPQNGDTAAQSVPLRASVVER